MAKNELTPLQDVATREFLLDVALAENVFGNHPSLKRQLIGLLYELLNYQRLTDGRFVSKDKKITYKLGGSPSHEEFPDEWAKDYENALMKLGKGERRDLKEKEVRPVAGDSNYTYEADSSEQTKNSPFWKTLLSKDV